MDSHIIRAEEEREMMRRFRRGPRGRLPKPIRIGVTPNIRRFIPIPQLNPTPIYIEPAEIEALRLVDLEGLTQEAAAERMGISRGTVWRLLQSARKKMIQAIIECRPILIFPNP